MSLIFKHGALSSDQQRWAQDGINKYPYPVLLKENIGYQWAVENLLEHNIYETSCFGQSYIRTSHMYMSFTCTAGVLYFFLDKRDYNKVCELKADILIDSNPFMTVIPNETIFAR